MPGPPSGHLATRLTCLVLVVVVVVVSGLVEGGGGGVEERGPGVTSPPPPPPLTPPPPPSSATSRPGSETSPPHQPYPDVTAATDGGTDATTTTTAVMEANREASMFEAFNESNWLDFDEAWSAEEKQAWLQLRLLGYKRACYETNTTTTTTTSTLSHSGVGWCPRVWDELLCWGPAPPNTSVTQPCPHYVPGILPQGVAGRRCGPEGAWVGDIGTLGWTNYTDCLPSNDTHHSYTVMKEWLPTIKKMSVVGYSVSLVTLIISFIILASLRKLRCPRNLLHLHLFGSFMLRAVVVLLKSFVLQYGLSSDADLQYDPNQKQTWTCKLLISVWQYFILANYSWLLMEGLYLHSLIFMALFTDSSAITLYILLGWGLPLGCVVVWAGLKAGLDDTHCWTVNTVPWIFWLCIRAPVAISNLINFFFFLNVVRVLVLKLRSSISAESMKYRKLGKSTLVLVPLFGVHYFLLWGLSTSNNEYVELVWLLLDQVFASFQGFFVAVLYCLMNGEVRQELRKLYNRWYKGDPLVVNSHSTLVSNTKTYASRGRMSLHSIHSQAERRERQTPSPQMPWSGGGETANTANNAHTNNASPSPTKTLTPAYGTRYQSRDVSSCLGSSEWWEETIELQACTLSESSQSSSRPSPQPDPRYSPPRLRPTTPAVSPSPRPPSATNCSEGPPVEILIDLHQDGDERPDDGDDGSDKSAITHDQQASTTKDKHLTFSESTDQFQMAKSSPAKVNGSVVASEPGTKDEDSRGVICVNVNRNSLKSSSPVQIDSHILKKSKGKEHETML